MWTVLVPGVEPLPDDAEIIKLINEARKRKARRHLPYRMAIRNLHGVIYRKVTAMGADQFFFLSDRLDDLGLVGTPMLSQR
ncbi:MAG: hypothetical protein JOY84_00835 [Curvibacter sp.]|nr:hypothetical protein [Curvibacter sp.]